MPSATENKGGPPDMSEAHLLAPWYAAGNLGEAESRELEELAKEDPEFALLIEEAKREAEAATAVNEALGKPSPAVWERIERSIENEKRVQASVRRAGFIEGVKTSLSGFFAGLSAPQWQGVAAAAVAVCIIQAGAIAYLANSGGEPAKYGTASGPKKVAAIKPAFIVSFSQTATMGEVNALLDGAGLTIADGPNADMVYHLSLRDDNVESKEGAYKKLRSSAVVKLVLPEK